MMGDPASRMGARAAAAGGIGENGSLPSDSGSGWVRAAPRGNF